MGELEWVHLLDRERNSCPCPVLSAARPGVVCPLRPPRIHFYWRRLRLKAAACIAPCQFMDASRMDADHNRTRSSPNPPGWRLRSRSASQSRVWRFMTPLRLAAALGKVVVGIRFKTSNQVAVGNHAHISSTCAIGA